MPKQTTTLTYRTLRQLRAMAWTADVTERWLPKVKKRKDLYGFCDVLAMRPDRGFMAVQATSRDHVLDRLKKISKLPAARTWLLSGGSIEVWGWWKCHGKWMARRRPVTLSDLRTQSPGAGL